MAKKRKKQPPMPRKVAKNVKIRAGLVFTLMLGLLLVLMGRILFITRNDGENYNKQILRQMSYSSKTIEAERGQILDRNGTCLAYNVNYYNLILEPKNILSDVSAKKEEESDEAYEKRLAKSENLTATVNALVATCGVDEKDAREQILAHYADRPYYLLLEQGLSKEQKDNLEQYQENYSLRRKIKNAENNNKLTDAKKLKEQLKEQEKKAPIKAADNDPLTGSVLGVNFENKPKRYYPYGSFASNVIGFSNNQGGVCGLEKSYNKLLSGVDGRTYGYLNENSTVDVETVPEQDGYTIVSTIDSYIQRTCEKILANYEKKTGSRISSIMVMNPNNAEVLAMAVSNTYDLNTERDADMDDILAIYSQKEYDAMTDEEKADAKSRAAIVKRSNFCVNSSYEPGSVAKSFTVAAALEEHTATVNSSYYCNGVGNYGGSKIHCHLVTGHGPVTLKGALMASCNDALMQIGVKLGAERFTEYQQLFGIGQKTGIDLPDEESCSGQIYNADNMDIASLATNSFGQNFFMTMTQMCAGYCALVNGGYYYQPHVVKQIRNSDGEVVENVEPVLVRQAISASTSNIINDALFQTVQTGTGKPVKIEGYEIGGKTGTAEKNDQGSSKRELYTVSFMATAPASDPEVIVYVVVDEPNCTKQENSVQAKPIAKKVLEEILPYLNIYPSGEEDVDTSDGDYSDAKYEENDNGGNSATAREIRDAAQEALDNYNQ